MTTSRIQRILTLTALGLGIGVVSFHAVYKPAPESGAVSGITTYMRDSARWIGTYPPDFRIRLRNGEYFQLAEHIGREVIILNFFTTWCGPCKEEMPELHGYYLKNREHPIALVGIDVDEAPEKVDAFANELGLTFPLGIDTNSVIANRYGVRSYPTTVLIGADGKVRLFQIGGIANADVVFTSHLADQFELLKQGRGIERAAYEAGASNRPALRAADRTHSSKAKESDVKLGGPARAAAERMACPSCGSSVYACSCGLCESMKKRLAELNVTNKTDDQILHDVFIREETP